MSNMNLAVTVSMLDRFTAPAKKIAGVTGDLSKALMAGQQSLGALGKSSATIARFKVLKKSIVGVASEMKAAQKNTALLAREIKAADKPSKALIRDFEQAKKKSARLKASYQGQKLELHHLRTEMRSAGVDTKKLGSAQKQLSDKIAATTKKMELQALRAAKVGEINRRRDASFQSAASLTFVGDAIGRVGRGMVGALTKPIEAATSFESTMADVRKVVNFESPKQFRQMRKDILAMSTVIPVSAKGLGDIVAAAGQSNIPRDQLLSFAESAAKMGVAFDLTGAQAGGIMAGWRSSMKLTQAQTNDLADAVNFLSNNMNAKAGDLADVISRQGAVAKAAGLTTAETAALGAVLLSSGAPAEIAATGLKNLTLSLSAGTAATRIQKTALASLGIDATEMAQRMQVDAKGAIMAVFKAMSQLDKAKQPAILKQLFGLETVGAIAPILSNLEAVQRAFDLTSKKANFAGSAQAEFEVRSKTTANAMQLFNARMERLKINFGDKMLPILNKLLDVVSPILDGLASLANRFPTATTAILGAVAILGGIALVLGPVVTAVAALTGALAFFRAGLAKTRLAAETSGGGGGFFGGGGKGKGGIKGFFGKLFSRKGFGGALKGAGGFLKGKGGYIGAGLAALSIGSTLLGDSKNKGTEIAKDVGGIGGALAGGAGGAALGTLIGGPIGTAIGGALGFALGALGFNLGSDAGGALAGLFSSDKKPSLAKKAVPAALAATLALASPAAAAPTVNQDNRASYVMHINVAGGDPAQVKDAVSQALTEKEREHAANTRGAMFDLQGG